MRLILVSVFFILTGSIVVQSKNLPEKFFGTFKLDHSENFDEYMKAEGYGWITRKLVNFVTVTKAFTKAGPNTFNFDNLSTKKDIHYKNVELDETFIGEGIDSTKHKITFSLHGDKLREHHLPIEEGAQQKEAAYVFYVEGDMLIQILESGDVVAKRYYKRVPKVETDL